MAAFLQRLLRSFRRRRLDLDLDDELAFTWHLYVGGPEGPHYSGCSTTAAVVQAFRPAASCDSRVPFGPEPRVPSLQ
jgi:hypothetical protein